MGGGKGIWPVKKIWGDGGGRHRLVWMEWHPAGWSVCLPLLIFPCTKKSRSSLLAPAHPGDPRKRAVKQLWCGGDGNTYYILIHFHTHYITAESFGLATVTTSGENKARSERAPMECMRPLSMLALRRFDIARTVQLRRALRLLTGHFLSGPSAFSSESSEQSFSRFINSVKYLQERSKVNGAKVRRASPFPRPSVCRWLDHRTHGQSDDRSTVIFLSLTPTGS